MPEKKTLKRARKAKRAGKAPSTQAGEFVREEIEHVRHGKHGVRTTKQAIAIGLSKARRAGVKLKAPPRQARKGQAKKTKAASRSHKKPSAGRSRAATKALGHGGKSKVSHAALAKQAKSAARRRKRAA